MIRPLLAAAIAAPFLASAAARADPCEGPLPTAAGRTFSGPVRYVGDGDSLCVGRSANPKSWIEVRLADFDAPELQDPRGARAKALLQRLTRGRQLVCRATSGGADALSSMTV
jgi:endonuclease YncB( thermonuclease family)